MEAAAERGIDRLLVSPWPAVLGEAFESEPQAVEMCRLQNRELAALTGPVSALGTVPLRAPALAAAELRRLLDLGLHGVEVSPAPGGSLLGDDAFEPFWKAAERLGAIVLIHAREQPDAVQPALELVASAASMVTAGVLERHPELCVLLADGGAGVTAMRGRLDRAWEAAPTRRRLAEPPSASLRRLRYDTAVHETGLLRELVEFAGAGHVLLGSGYPGPFAESDPVGVVLAADLGEAAERAVLGGNAAALLGFPD